MADANTFYLKRHDTAPAYQCTLADDTGAAVPLTGAAVTFIMSAVGSNTPKVNAAAVIVDAPNGVVSYTWTSSNTDTSGTFNVEWQVVFSDGSKETFPDPGYNTIIIGDDLDNA